MEVAVVSSRGDSVSSSIWNPFTNSLLASYSGGGSCSSHGLCALNGYLISNETNKPMLHAWPLNKQHPISKRLIAPGKITCVSLSPDGNYTALSVDCKLHVYQNASGVLCGVGGNHFQSINVIKFNPEGTFISCGGEDGVLTVWHLGDIVQINQSNKKPFLSINAHSLPINDLILTGGDLRSRVISVSLDRSCKIHDIWTKDKLFSGHFENQLTALALCPRESAFYMGDAEGGIREVGLLAPPRKVNNHYSNSSNQFLMVKFQESKITSLSISLDSSLILSGSSDCTVKVIHIKSRQCVQTITLKGPITNCFFYVLPTDCFTNTFKPSLELNNFTTKESTDDITFDIFTSCDISSGFDEVNNDVQYSFTNDSSDHSEINGLKAINNELYQFAVDKLMSNAHSHVVKEDPTVLYQSEEYTTHSSQRIKIKTKTKNSKRSKIIK